MQELRLPGFSVESEKPGNNFDAVLQIDDSEIESANEFGDTRTEADC